MHPADPTGEPCLAWDAVSWDAVSPRYTPARCQGIPAFLLVSLILGLAVFQVETVLSQLDSVQCHLDPLCPTLPFSFPFPSFLSLSSLPSISSLPSFLPSLNYHDYMSGSVQNIEKPCPNKTCKKGETSINQIITQLTVVISGTKQRCMAL